MLGDLFARYGSDKHWHGYHRLYESLFPDPARVGAVLEVGVGTRNPDGVDHTVHAWFPEGYQPGGSLRAFADFFPNAEVLGIDTQPDCLFTADRILTVLCDSTDPAHTAGLPVGFDLIVDDGDHTPWAQRATLTNLWPLLADGGVYVIEDVGAVSLRDVVDVVGLPNWAAAHIVPSLSCPDGFIAIAVRKGVSL